MEDAVQEPSLREMLEKVDKKLDQLLTDREIASSPWLRGDKAAALYSGFKSTNAFLTWAQSRRIKPIVDGRIKLWDRMAIAKARKAKQTY